MQLYISPSNFTLQHNSKLLVHTVHEGILYSEFYGTLVSYFGVLQFVDVRIAFLFFSVFENSGVQLRTVSRVCVFLQRNDSNRCSVQTVY